MLSTGLLARIMVASVAIVALAAFPAPSRAQDAAEIMLRLDRLEAENRRLNGQIEELRFANRRLEDQLKRFQNDADLRMRDLEAGRAGSGARPQTPPASPPVATPGATPNRRSDAFDPTQGGNAAGAPRPLTPGQAGSAPIITSAQQQVGGAPQPLPGSDAKSDFEFAKGLFDRGDFELSEGAFREFLRKYPRDRRAAEATFWLGESYFNRTRHREAAEQFLTVTTKFSNASRAPEAMLKLGMSLRALGAKDEACGTFDQVGRKYPKAPAAIIAATNREKARAQC